ncbi:ankyrin repeat domain 34Bb [Xiphophorus couchianus]|uniref:ankyrin repeat domain 34Bb n=1 Tax=Xiphophorus couchianus TaxID=32473 RepID=UPI001016FE6B|nr:ankyrin repeat domain-containing protein 34B-like [Xiphophorus couchianus]
MNESTEVVMDGSSLLKAVYHSRLRLTRLLLEGGAYINESNEYGETPLMVACKTQHTNPQSVPKPKMVRYLLENGADPNIQDKTGKTALMHSCLEQADPEVLSLLLDSGADPTLEDHAGLSALVYAVNSGNRKILSVLLGACKAKGKEVIIITTSKMASDQQMTKQYLNVPPSSVSGSLSYTSVCSYRSPYESQTETLPHSSLTTPSLQTCSSLLGPSMIMFQPVSSAQPSSPVHISDLDKQLYPYKVHTEQRSKSSSLLLQQNQACSLIEEPVENTFEEEELSIRLKAFGIQRRPPAISRHHSIDVKDGTQYPKSLDHISGNEIAERRRRGLGRKMSYDSAASSLHALSHPNLHQDSLPFSSESSPVDEDSSDCLRQLNISSLQNVVNRRNIGMDHYSSDSQLLQVGSWEKILKSGGGAALERHKPMNSRHFTLSETKDSLESFVPRRGAAGLERRGSGALLLDRIAHTRPGFLPPLNPRAPIPDIGASPSFSSSSSVGNGVLAGSKSVLPSVPAYPQDLKIKKILWRRHSMQSEQIKQLVSFRETLGN